ncbi:MAG: DUF4446 family protein [Candidatus Zambryskibacteria bacterium]|nr:DUF4446 family protein [Candidatus Zambryskibacteria bacterium]
MAFNWDLTLFFISLVAIVVALIALIIAIIMQVKVRRIFRSANTPNLERLIGLHSKTLENLLKFQTEATGYIKSLDKRVKTKTNSAYTLRFNSFQGEGIGGNQSFSSVLTDEEGNGVIITSMHTRERTNVFAKPLKNWLSEYQLSEEEKKALKWAEEK